MNRRFALPIAITLSAHAILLLGSSRPTRQITVKPKEPPIIWVIPNPPKDEEIAENKETDAANGKKDVEAPPSLPPLQPVVTFKNEITMTEAPSIPASITKNTNVLPIGTPGQPGGIGDQLHGTTLVSLDQLDNSPRTKFQAAPQYPYALKAAGITGSVFVEFTVDETGRVLNPHIVSSTHPEFETPTLRAVQTWRFEPGKHLGRVVRFRMSVPVQFSISDRD